jgi:hypothetical protein
MKTIKFRPLRRIKKTGKIVVSSYGLWRQIKSADSSTFNLIIDETFKTFPKNELVYNHLGENLFWRHFNPEEIELINDYVLVDGEKQYPKMWKTDYGMYCAKGLDVDGVPCFSHGDTNEIINSMADVGEFNPLTVGVVRWWFNWFVNNLENAKFIN